MTINIVDLFTDSYFNEISRERVEGAASWHTYGQRMNVGTALADVWEGTAATIPYPASTGEQIEFVSSSVNDRAGGTGVRAIHIHYLDSNSNEQEESIDLFGTNPVFSVATNVQFINEMHSVEVGNIGVSAGIITAYKLGAPTTVYSQINAGGNMSLSSYRMVPSDKNLFLTDFGATSTEAKSVSVRMRATAHMGTLYPNIFIFNDTCYIVDSACSHEYTVPIKFPPLTKIKVSAIGGAAGANVSVHLGGWLESV